MFRLLQTRGGTANSLRTYCLFLAPRCKSVTFEWNILHHRNLVVPYLVRCVKLSRFLTRCPESAPSVCLHEVLHRLCYNLPLPYRGCDAFCAGLRGKKNGLVPCTGARNLLFWRRIKPCCDLDRRLGRICMPDCKFLIVSAGISSLTADLALLAAFQYFCTLNYLISYMWPLYRRVRCVSVEV